MLIYVYCAVDTRSQTIVFSRFVTRAEFPVLGQPTRCTLNGAHEDFGAKIDIRVYKYTGFSLTFHNASVCAHTDGSTCDDQVVDDSSCPTPAPVPPVRMKS